MIKNKNIKKPSVKREKQTRYLSQAIQLEEAVNPHIVRATMTMVSLAILVFLGWAGLTNINEVARTPGEVVPFGYQQTVQHLEGGLVKAIHVHEGDVVEAGQLLITLHDGSIKEDLQRAEIKQLNLEMQGERLRAFIANREPDFVQFKTATSTMIQDQKDFFEGMRNARQKEEDIVQDQEHEKRQAILTLKADLETAQKDLKISEALLSQRRALNEEGVISNVRLFETKRDFIQGEGNIKRLENQVLVAYAEIKEYQDRLESLSAKHRDEALQELSSVAAEKAQNVELIHKLEERISRLEIKAPARGLVKGLNVNTIGAVVQSGQTIMEIVPIDKDLEVSVKISPQDIGHLRIGQDVQIKFSTFDFSRYGSVGGQLEQISATTFSGENGERYYQGRVVLDRNYVGKDLDNRIMPGMTVMADIITGEKTVLEYILKPIHVSLKTAFTER